MSTPWDSLGACWLNALAEGSQEIIALFAADGTLLFVNRALEALLGLTDDEVRKGPSQEIVHSEDRTRLRDALEELVQGAEPITGQIRMRHRLGHFVRLEVHGASYVDDPAIGAIVVHARATESSSSTAAVGIRNRALFTQRVTMAIEIANKTPELNFAVLLVEIEQFKRVLGTYGLVIAEHVETAVWQGIRDVLGPEDLACKLGSGEFAILMPEVVSKVQASRAADVTRKAGQVRIPLDGGDTIATSVAVGIATSERGYTRPEDILRDATAAMNRARGAKGQSVFHTQMREEDEKYLALVTGMRNALINGEFRVHFQPIVSLNNRRWVGFEALVRWEHPKRGLVSPADFIPIAEETGLIGPLGEWVLETACTTVGRWNGMRAGKTPLSVAVNISPVQLAQRDIVELVQTTLTKTQFPARHLKLEVTESAVLDEEVDATTTLRQLSEMGVRLSLDDFGTGYSSFSYLHQLPYDTLKVDRAFVAEIEQKRDRLAIVQAIVSLAHNLGLEVVAEGVETRRQEELLTSLHCEYGQGYLYSKPLSAEEVEKTLAELITDTIPPSIGT